MKSIPFFEFADHTPKVVLQKNKSYAFVDMETIVPGRRYIAARKKRDFTGSGSRFQSNDVLFARITPCLENGKIAQFVDSASEAVGFGSTEFFVFRAKKGISDPAFLFYLCITDILRKPAEKSMAGASGRQRADLRSVLSVNVPCPPLPTQRKIAGILSAYDDLIENNTRRIAILEEMAQAIYREWFVNFRFPGHENVKLVDSPLGKIPEGWRALSLSNIANVNALTIRKGNEPPEVNYVDIASVSTGMIEEIRLLPFAEAPGRARRIVLHGDLIWSTVRPNRKSYSLILNPLPNMIVSTGFAVISGTKAPFSYLYHVLTTDDFVGYLVNHATGSAYPAVNSESFEKASIIVPPQDLLGRFHDIAEPMFLSRHCLAEKNKNLRKTRDLLLPKLISGQLDVEELDIETGETLLWSNA